MPESTSEDAGSIPASSTDWSCSWGVTLRTTRVLGCLLVAGLTLSAAACSVSPTDSSAGQAETSTTPSSTSAQSEQRSTPKPSTEPPEPSKPVRIAFAGDVHFAGSLESRLDDPATAMGPLTKRLTDADLAMVNLETAVTTRGVPQPKDYVFRAPPVVFDALTSAGIDVVSMANNHGLDYGPVSVPDALTAARDAGMPVVGLGRDAGQAYRPWVTTVHGQRIAFLAATAVVDASLVDSWSAGDDQPGVATALDGDNAALVAAIRAVRPHVDTVVVDMHYGSDLMRCPTDIQRAVARDAVRAGADVVVGQHAHVVLGGGYLGSAYVHYGLGNFQFYSSGGQTAETGVLELTVDGRRVTNPVWRPGRLVGGLPTAVDGPAADDAIAQWDALRDCSGLRAAPAG